MPQLDFADIKSRVSIERVATEMLKLELSGKGDQLRGPCPITNNADPRAFVITISKQAFYSFKAKKGGDALTLVAMVNNTDVRKAAEAIVSYFGLSLRGSNSSSPPSPPAGGKWKVFDADAFAEALAFTDEVKALNITPEQAKQLGIGMHRGKLYIAMRYESGIIAGFVYSEGGKLVLPKNLLPDLADNIVPLRA